MIKQLEALWKAQMKIKNAENHFDPDKVPDYHDEFLAPTAGELYTTKSRPISQRYTSQIFYI